MEGLTLGVFAPDEKLTRGQFAVMLSRALQLDTSITKPHTFIDLQNMSPSSLLHLQAVVREGLMNGMDESHFKANEYVTREMIAVIMIRAKQMKR